MKHSIFHCTRIAVLVSLAASLFTGLAQPAAAQAQLAVFILHPLVEIYEGDTITLPYMVEDIAPNAGLLLAPLTPGSAVVTASLGSVSVVPEGLGGSITYTAEKHGSESIQLTVSNYFGSVTGSIELEIKPRPNYDLDFLIVSHATDEAGGGFMAVFTGEGEFANVDDAPIQGKGSSDLWFSLWVENNVMACVMEPTVRGNSNFEVAGVTGPASLVPMPGSIDPFILDLNFQPISLNASTIACQGMGGISANFPWPASQGNPDDYRLKSLFFPGEGGFVTITAPKTWGYVWVERK